MSSQTSDSLDYKVNGGTYPPFGVITPTDKGSIVIIATWIAACTSVLFTSIRVSLRIRLYQSQAFGGDVLFICVALCFAIAQSVAAQESVRYGLGKHRAVLDDEQFASFSTYAYVGQILSIFVFVLSKLSLVVIFNYLIQNQKFKYTLWAFTSFITLWGISDLFSTAFQCGGATRLAPAPGCINVKALLLTRGLINIASDAFLALFPVAILWKVKIQPKKRCIILAMFSTRIVVCVIVSIQLSTLGPYLSGQDSSWYFLYPCFWNQLAVHLSVITACIPMIKSFLDNLRSSLTDSSIPRNFQSQLTFDLQPRHLTKHASNSSMKMKSLKSLFGIESEVTGRSRNRSRLLNSQNNTSEGIILVQREVDVRVA